MTTTIQPLPAVKPADGRRTPAARPDRRGRVARLAVLSAGALIFLFPFYYMLVGSFQREPDPGIGGAFPSPGDVTLDNYAEINGSISLLRSLANSGLVTGGVLLGTVTFGMLAGYALALLSWRGRSTLFASVLLVQVIPFQLLMIPLYVLIVRSYGLADSYLGMMLPFLISPTAVLIFRQFFKSLPEDVFASARLDGANELQVLRYIALPLVRPALLTVVLVTFIGPWNEFLWPFLVTKRADMQPLAVALANYISNISGQTANPYGAILAGACVLAAPAIGLFIIFQRRFVSTDVGSSIKG